MDEERYGGSINSVIASRFQMHLESSEYIVCCGKGIGAQSGKAASGPANIIAKLPLYFFAIIWTSFAIFWTVGATKQSGISFGCFGIPFILVGIYLFADTFRKSSGGSKYYFAVTNMRILKITDNGLEMEYLTNITFVTTEENNNRTDVVYSLEYRNGDSVFSTTGTIGGLSPDEAENVRYAIESESTKAHTYF